jgi:hypothetical protein
MKVRLKRERATVLPSGAMAISSPGMRSWNTTLSTAVSADAWESPSSRKPDNDAQAQAVVHVTPSSQGEESHSSGGSTTPFPHDDAGVVVVLLLLVVVVVLVLVVGKGTPRHS